MKTPKFKKKLVLIILVLFFLMNLVAFIHAYKFTHFSDNNSSKTKNPEKLSFLEKVKTLAFGVNNPKPKNIGFPTQDFETLKLNSNKKIECWFIKNKKSKGTVILFHGYGAEKSSMLDKSNEFIEQGFNTLLVDFMGSGNSEGNQTTIGYKEAEQVKTTFDYLTQKGEKNIYLFGTSMGSVAIMKCINDYNIKPKAIIIECPFGSMYKTICARFNRMNAPTFPMAGTLLFWGGIQNGFWGFNHNPTEYAKKIVCPTLLLYGEKDKSVSRGEIDEIFSNLSGIKKLNVYKETGHENYLIKNKIEWTKNIADFIKIVENKNNG
jgi:alpha-beta hydrolase superfamily lysophospholipase